VVAVQDDAARRGVTVTESIAHGDISIYGDENRLRQALLNVLLNAVQATGEGGRIEVAVAGDETVTTIRVSDTGHGIEEKDLREVTKPFYTRRAGGSGLGLSIVQSIVEEHGGSLGIDSHPGEGTRVTMTFPARRHQP
jgi:signal transduction histidine kinase